MAARLSARNLYQTACPWKEERNPRIYPNREAISICSVHFNFSSSAFGNSKFSHFFVGYVCSLENNLLETFVIARKFRSKLNITSLSVPLVSIHFENGVENLVMDRCENEFL